MKNIEKLLDVAAYIISKNDGSMNYTKLIKELYLCDKESLKETGFSISGDSYVSMKQGPVLSTFYSLINNNCMNDDFQQKWNICFYVKGYSIFIKPEYTNKKQLSKFEKRVMDNVSNMYKDKNWFYIVDNILHNPRMCPEYDSSVQKTNTSKPISLKSIFKRLGFSDNQIRIAIEEHKSYGL